MSSSSRPNTSSNTTVDAEYNQLLWQIDYVEGLLYFLGNGGLGNREKIETAVIRRKGIKNSTGAEKYYDLSYLSKIGAFNEFGNLDLSQSGTAIAVRDKGIDIDTTRFGNEAKNHENDWSKILISAVKFTVGDFIVNKVINWRSIYLPGTFTPRQMRSEIEKTTDKLQEKIKILKLTAPNQYTLSLESLEELETLHRELITTQKTCLPLISEAKKQWELAVYELYMTHIEQDIQRSLDETDKLLTRVELTIENIGDLNTPIKIKNKDKGKEQEIEEEPTIKTTLFSNASTFNFTYLSFNMQMTQNVIALASYWIALLKNDYYWQIQYQTSAQRRVDNFKLTFLESISNKAKKEQIQIPDSIIKLQKVIQSFEKQYADTNWQLEDAHVAVSLIISLKNVAKQIKEPVGATKSHKEVLRRLRTPLFLASDNSYILAALPRQRERLIAFIATRKNIKGRDKSFLSEDPFYQKNEHLFKTEVDRKLGKPPRNNLKK